MTYTNQPFYDNGPHPLLWAGPRAAREKIVISGTNKRLNCCVICIVYTQFTNVAAGRIIPPGRPQVG